MYDVAVIGAGVAGMVAARECLAAGLSVRLFEAKSRAGGRLYAESTAQGGSLELGGQFFHLETSPAVSAELERYGIRSGPAMSCRRQVVWSDGELHELSALFRANPSVLRELVTTIKSLVTQLQVESSRIELERLSAEEGLTRLSIPPAISTWFRGWIEQYAGTDLKRISAANMLGLVEAHGGSLRAASHVSGEWLTPDTRALTDGLWGDVAEASELSSEVTQVMRSTGGTGFQLNLRGSLFFARSVVVAAPRNVIASGTGLSLELGWPGGLPQALQEPQPGLGHKAWVRLSRGAPEATTVVGDLGGFRLLAIGNREPDGSAWGVLFGNEATFAQTTDLSDLEEAARNTVQLVWGDDVRVLETQAQNWVSDPFARGAWTVAPVQQSDPISELHAAAPPGVAFAGADFSSRRGGVESALRSGFDAAERIVTYIAVEGARNV